MQGHGLVIKDIKKGTGPAAKAGDTVSVNYVGTLTNGTLFDTNKKPGGQPLDFVLGQHSVITGWDQGLLGMKAGGTRKLIIPPDLAYGPQGNGPIPPNSTLVFMCDMIKINGKGAPAAPAHAKKKAKHHVSKKGHK
jgi:FKBP-type peptidyl-prolyl cis-trans isomerase